MNLYYFDFKTSEGNFYCIYRNENAEPGNDLENISVCYLGIGRDNFDRYIDKLKKIHSVTGIEYKENFPLSSAVTDFLSGKRKSIDFKTFFLTGTEFQQTVWNKAKEIKYGDKISYKQLSEKVCKNIGRPKSYRAVGNALGKNPLILIVPCHRIIKSNGEIGYFSSGVPLKKMLLDLESENSTNP